ncbi:lipase family protein [Nocardia yamanashiensis]|uniref:lipase family protein n=1 Tax=Nocardia yamanashiensis TaxID=209247 RepID=UPI001E4ED8B8|nr:lipase family protein [Nocardia yamanashiensis]UGT38745.1 lipase family protein [Nocardia yamanashiensis]
MMLRRTVFGVLCATALVLPTAILTGVATADPGVPAFYDPPTPLPAGAAGELVRSEPVALTLAVPGQAGPLPGTATRIMFHTRDTHGDPALSSGIVLKPAAAWSGPGPQPLIAYLNGVHGMGRQCAPSIQIPGLIQYTPPLDVMAEYELPFLYLLLAQGFAVVVPDYPGLGAGGNPSALDPIAESRTALDAIRAAQRLGDPAIPAHGPVVVTGYSQGGNAAAGVAEEQPAYAPELDLRGVAAGSVPIDIPALRTAASGAALGGIFGYLLNTLAAQSPETARAISGLLSPAGHTLMRESTGQCAAESILRFGFQDSAIWSIDGRPLLEVLDEHPIVHAAIQRLTLGNRTPGVPVLLYTGDNDDLPADSVRELAARWCGSGAAVQLFDTGIPTLGPGLVIGHSLNLITAYPTVVLDWVRARLTAAPAPSICS